MVQLLILDVAGFVRWIGRGEEGEAEAKMRWLPGRAPRRMKGFKVRRAEGCLREEPMMSTRFQLLISRVPLLLVP